MDLAQKDMERFHYSLQDASIRMSNSPDEPRKLSLTATSIIPELSMVAANAVSQVFKDYAKGIMKLDAVNIVETAELPESPSGPSRARNTLLAMIVSLMLGVGVSIAIELFNTTLRSAQEAENMLSLPVLASIQDYKKEMERFIKRRQKGDTLFKAVSEATRENAKSLATNLQFAVLSRPLRCITVTSSISEEGKSSLLLLLAEALAEMGKTVLLVDMDMRNPSIGKYLGMRGRNDLFDYLMETARLEEVICKTQNSSVFFVDSRHRLAAAHQMAAYERFDLFLSGAQQMFDVILFDTPPLGLFADAAVLANKTDGALLVVGSGMTDRALVRDMAGQLHKANANILGVVMNFVDERHTRRKHYYKKYYGRYAAEERAQSKKEPPAMPKKAAEEV
jgi:capsular exopolysaccharide synthesis family protein